MSEFIAEAQVLVTPNTAAFRTALEAQLLAATKGVVIPIAVAPVASKGVAEAAAATSTLTAASTAAQASTLSLTRDLQAENATLVKQVELLQADAVVLTEVAGASDVAASAARRHAIAQGQVGKAATASIAGMLGLRGAVLTAGTAFIAATVGFQALGKAVGSFIDFQQSLNVFKIVAGATADEMERVSEAARELGRDITLPGVSASDAAVTLTELAKAGLSVEDSLGAVRGTLQLATAAQIDNAAATELVANTLNAFKLSGEDATKVADLLAGAANESQGSITDMGLALKQTSAIASGLGISVEDTVTILTQLARAGLSASDAGTSFRQTLLRLIQDLPKVDAEVRKLGLQLRDASGNIRPEVFEELGRKLQTLTPRLRQLAIANLGGADAIRTLLILTRAQAGEFDAVQASITQVGIAQDVAAAQTAGLGGDVEAAKNQFADLGLTIGKVTSGPLSVFVKTAGAAAGAVNELNTSVGESAGGGGFFATFGDVLDGIQDSFSDLNISFQGGVRAAQAQSDEFKLLASSGNVVSDTLKIVKKLVDDATAAFQRGAPAVASLTSALHDLGVQSARTQADLLRLQTEGGTPAQQIGVLQSDVETQRQIIAQAKAQGGAGSPTAIKKAREQILRDQAQIKSLQAGITSDAEAAAREARTEADKAQEFRDKQFQAIADMFGARQENIENAIERAGIAGNVAKELRLNQALIKSLKKELEALKERLKILKVSAEVRKKLLEAINDALEEAQQDRLRLQQEQQENLFKRLDFRVSLAQAQDNTAAEIKARRARLAAISAELARLKNAHKKNTDRWRELRLALAEEVAAIKELEGEQKEKKSAQKSFFFEFLQTQQGFAANLLGNLIPGFATKGLVGGSTPAAGAEPLRQVAGGFEQPRGALSSQAALSSSRERGVRPVQIDTTNHLLRQILRSLQNLNGRASHPEAKYQNRVAGSNMDTIGGV